MNYLYVIGYIDIWQFRYRFQIFSHIIESFQEQFEIIWGHIELHLYLEVSHQLASEL